MQVGCFCVLLCVRASSGWGAWCGTSFVLLHMVHLANAGFGVGQCNHGEGTLRSSGLLLDAGS